MNDFNKQIELEPNEARNYLNRAFGKSENKNFEGAISDLSIAISMTPTYAKAYCNRGFAKKELKKYVEQRTFRTQIATFKNKLTFDADMKIAPMSESDAKATLGDLHCVFGQGQAGAGRHKRSKEPVCEHFNSPPCARGRVGR